MTPSEVRAARLGLGLTAEEMATVLRLGTGAERTVRRWESGESGVPGPAEVAIEAMAFMVAKGLMHWDGKSRRWVEGPAPQQMARTGT